MADQDITFYSCVFAFSSDLSQVVLIRKARPRWQAGMLNGIGGHVEAGEDAAEAARREFREEAGVDLPHLDFFLGFGGNRFHISWYCVALTEEQFDAVRTMTDEVVEKHPVAALPDKVIANLRWMIPMALNRLTGADVAIHHVQGIWPEE